MHNQNKKRVMMMVNLIMVEGVNESKGWDEINSNVVTIGVGKNKLFK